MHNLIEQHPKRPDISLRSIYVVQQSLRSHIGWRADTHIFELPLAMRCKPEVSYLRLPSSQQDICCFDVPVDDAHRLQVKQALKNVFYYGVCHAQVFLFTEVSFLQTLREVSSFTVLVDSVAVVGGFEVFEAGDHIGMSQPTNDIDFLPKQVLNPQIPNLPQLNHLHSHLRILGLVARLVDLGEGALAQFRRQVYRIILDAFFVFRVYVGGTFGLFLGALPVEVLDGLADVAWLLAIHILSQQNKMEVFTVHNKNTQLLHAVSRYYCILQATELKRLSFHKSVQRLPGQKQ